MIGKHRLGNTYIESEVYILAWSLTYQDISYYDLCMLDLWFFLGCFSQIKYILT